MQENIDPIDRSRKAMKSLMDLLTNGPAVAILAFFMITSIVSITLYISSLKDSRTREGDMYKMIIEEVRRQVPTEVEDQVSPIREKVTNTINKTDSAIVKTNDLLNKVDSLVSK